MIIQICIGSSCHMKGARDLVEMTKDAMEKNKLEEEISLAGSFCTGKCNRTGVTIQVDDQSFTGITRESFSDFFQKEVLEKQQG